MSSAPWRDQIKLSDQNERSDVNFRHSYPEFAGLGQVRRGMIVTLDENPRRRFNFLVNPSIISSTYGMSNFDVTNRTGVEEVGLEHMTDGLLGLSFAILLDRTYEVYNGNSRYYGGVLHDILALEQVLGMPPGQQSQVFRAQGGLVAERVRSNIQTAMQNVLKGVIVKKFLRFLFGSRYAFSFDGYVQSLSVDYTHFSNMMVPTRASVSISAVSFGVESGGSGPVTAVAGDTTIMSGATRVPPNVR